ncbi:MAG: HD domain-containing phosphohydrolase [Dehalococcoidia bacterium]
MPKTPGAGGDTVVHALHIDQTEHPGAPDPPNKDLTRSTTLYIAIVTLLAGLCVAYFAPAMSTDGWPGFVTLIVLAIVFERIGVTIYGETQISAGVVAIFAIAILYGTPGAAIAAPVVVLASDIFTTSSWYRRLFNQGAYTLTNISAALVFHALIPTDDSVTIWWVPAVLLAAVVNYIASVVLVGAAVSISTKERFFTVWREEHQWLFPYYVVFGLLGVALATAYLALGIPGILAFVAPPLMMRFALHQYVIKTEQTVIELKQKNTELNSANRDTTMMAQRLTETYNGTLEALVLALDARDRETKGHSLRVTEYAMAIARHIGVDESTQEWVDLQRGALLHDVGKIGVPDYILHKPGPLTPEEWDEMKRHPRIGQEMLHDIAFLAGAAAIVHAHHERFDGKGYPRGLSGDEIPLGARIFTVCDAFDAMTSDRPYRKALPVEVARDEMLRNSGTQFDPEVVQTFLLIFDELVEKAATADREGEHEESRLHARAA